MQVVSGIFVCGKRFDVAARVITFADPGGFNAYQRHCLGRPEQPFASRPAAGMEGRDARYRRRSGLPATPTLSELRSAVHQVVLHHDGCRSVEQCFKVLHDEHGLSAHFLVDGDGTIYQTLDVAECAFHAAGVNDFSIGIEIQNLADAGRFPDGYENHRPKVGCRVHGVDMLAFDFTAPQYEAVGEIANALSRILDIPWASPRDTAGTGYLRTVIPERDLRAYRGFIGHYHVTAQKWDPGPWSFSRMLDRRRARVSHPLRPPRSSETSRREPPVDAEDYSAVEKSSGRFPCGPVGRAALWHGGVHLAASPRVSRAVAPFGGRIVAARLGRMSEIGSTGFVLMRHMMPADASAPPFFSLLFHTDAAFEREEPAWLAQRRKEGATPGPDEVMLLDHAVDAGERVADVGQAGPGDARERALHFAVFSEGEVTGGVDPGGWQIVEGGPTARICRGSALLDLFDRPGHGAPRDGRVSLAELDQFFRSDPRRERLRRIAVHHRAEWTPEGWELELLTLPEMKAMAPGDRKHLLERQIEPAAWWTPRVARDVGLPADGYIYSYHPLGFVEWYWTLAQRAPEDRPLASPQGLVSGKLWKEDGDSAEFMFGEDDRAAIQSQHTLELEDLIEGYE